MKGDNAGVARALRVSALVGPLSYFLALLFMPLGLTAQASGELLLLDARDQTALSALAMVLCCLMLTLWGRKSGQSNRGLAAGGAASAVFALVGGALALCVRAAWVPTAVACLLCAAASLQVYGSACALVGAAAREVFTYVALGLLAAVVTSAVSSALPVEAYGTCALALVMAACAPCPWLAQRLSCQGPAAVPTDAEKQGEEGPACAVCPNAPADGVVSIGFAPSDGPEDADHARTDEPASGPHTGLCQLRHDWQPLVGGCICALSLGLGWAQGFASAAGEAVVFAVAGRSLAAFILLAFGLAHARGAVSTRAASAILFFAGALGVLAWVVGGTARIDAVVIGVAGLSQAVFIGIMLSECALTARDSASPASLTCMGLAFFFAAFLAGLVGSRGLSNPIASAVVATAYLAYLCAVHFSLLRRSARAEAPADDADTRAAARDVAQTPGFDDVCNLIAHEFSLSPRETEVLPLLVVGLSSAAVGERLFVSTQTAKSHKHRIYVKLGVHSHDELSALFAQRSAQAGARI